MEAGDGDFARVQSPALRPNGQRQQQPLRVPPPPLPLSSAASATAQLLRQQTTLESELTAELDFYDHDDDFDDDIESGSSSESQRLHLRGSRRHGSRGRSSVKPETDAGLLQAIEFTTRTVTNGGVAQAPHKHQWSVSSSTTAHGNNLAASRHTSETVRLSPVTRQSMETGITITAPGRGINDALQLEASLGDAKKHAQRTYLHGSYRANSYFAIRLLRLMQLLVALDVVALAFFYGNRSTKSDPANEDSLFVLSPFSAMFTHGNGCTVTISLAAMIYHLLPAVVVLGLPASGFSIFEPFKREDRISRGGRIQKVKRTLFLQFCEMTAVLMFLVTGMVATIALYHFVIGNLFNCTKNPGVYVFGLLAIAVYVLIYVEIRYFMRFREHLKMQLGAFSEADQTGDVKAHMLRSKLRRKRVQEEMTLNNATAAAGKDATNNVSGATAATTAALSPSIPARSQIVEFVRKRLYRGAQLGDLRLLKRTLRVAKTHLGDDFAKTMYPDARIVMWCWSKSTKNPMHVAAYHGSIPAMELLYRANFAINSFDKISRVRFSTGDIFWYLAHYFIRQPVVSAEDAYGASSIFKATLVTPLHCAVSTGRVDAVRWLLQHGADVNVCSRSSLRHESRLPPIFVADHPEIAKELLAAGANHLVIPDPGHMNTITVLQMAYLRGNYAVAQVLENWGGDVALTPLHTAAAMNNTNRIRQLLRKKVNPDCLGELGYIGLNKRTPLHWACVNGAIDAVELLLEAHANADMQDTRGRTPLHWAARVNRVEAVKILLRNGANPNIVDEGGMTPILCAACAGGTTAEMFKVLVSHGANINHQLPSTGDTALHIAVKLDDLPTAVALLSVGGDIMRMNHDGLRPIDCTTSTRLQFEIKRAAGNRDVMISYTHSHKEFALKLRKSLEDANITTWLDLMDPSGIGGGAVWREEIARGVTNAAMVLCILTEDYAQSQWCMKELALAKQVGTPILAISTEHAQISEELQVYLYTRQMIPFEGTITAVQRVGGKEIQYSYNEEAYKQQIRILLDGLRDEIEKRKEQVLRKNLSRAATASTMNTGGSTRSALSTLGGTALGASGLRARGAWNQASATTIGGVAPYSHAAVQFDERAPAAMVQERLMLESTGRDGFLFSSANMGGLQRSERPRSHLAGGRGQRVFTTNESLLSADNSFIGGGNELSFGGLGMNDLTSSIVLNPHGYYEHQNQQPRSMTGSVLETFQEIEEVVGGGQQFVFICHGDWHTTFVKRLCASLCREGGLHCYVDRRHRLGRLDSRNDVTSPPAPTQHGGIQSAAVANEAEDENNNEDMLARIHDAKEAILKCAAFVVVLSEKTLRTQLVKDQLAFAEDKGKKIIPVVVNALEFSLDMKYSLSRSDFFHFFTGGDMIGFEKSLDDVLAALREEIYGISVEPSSTHRLPKTYSHGQLSTLSGHDEDGDTGTGTGSIATFTSFGPGGLNLRRRHGSGQSLAGGGDTSSVASSNTRGGGWGLELPYSGRASNHSFLSTKSFGSAVTASPPMRPLTSDMSLQQSMLGNFSSLMRRITDDLEDYDDDDVDHALHGDEEGEDDEDDGNDVLYDELESLPELHRSISDQPYHVGSCQSFDPSAQELLDRERSSVLGSPTGQESRPGRLSSIISRSSKSVSILERSSDESSTIEAVRMGGSEAIAIHDRNAAM